MYERIIFLCYVALNKLLHQECNFPLSKSVRYVPETTVWKPLHHGNLLTTVSIATLYLYSTCLFSKHFLSYCLISASQQACCYEYGTHSSKFIVTTCICFASYINVPHYKHINYVRKYIVSGASMGKIYGHLKIKIWLR